MQPAPPISDRPSLVIEPQETKAPSGAERLKLTPTTITVEGVTAYTNEEIAGLLRPLTDREITVSDLFNLADELTAKYRNDGYILCQVVVPPQRVSDGKVRLQAFEGHIENTLYDGPAVAKVQEYAENIRRTKPFNVKEMERWLLLMKELPGVAVESMLQPSKSPGASDLTLKVTTKTVSLSSTLDNRGTRTVGPLQSINNITLNNISGLGEQVTVGFTAVPNRLSELATPSLSSKIVVGPLATAISLAYSRTYTRLGAQLSPLSINSRVDNLSLAVNQPILRSRSRNLTLTSALSGGTTNTRIFETTSMSKDRLRAIDVGILFDNVDQWEGQNVLGLHIVHGLSIFGGTRTGDPGTSSAVGRSDFVKFTGDISRLQQLGDGFAVLGAVSGQYSAVPLFSAQQFGLGGSQYVRAFDPSEFTGDRGIAAKIELQKSEALDGPVFSSITGFSYVDYGKVWRIKPGQGVDPSVVAGSVGGGFRLALTNQASINIELAKPVVRNTAVFNNKAWRLFFALSATY